MRPAWHKHNYRVHVSKLIYALAYYVVFVWLSITWTY